MTKRSVAKIDLMNLLLHGDLANLFRNRVAANQAA
jgi:hypothetical protein